MKKRDLLSVPDLSADEIREILVKAVVLKRDSGKFSQSLKGKALAMIFEKPSLRTRVTFDVGIHQLGGYSVDLSSAGIRLGERETVCDVAKNLERMVDGILIRTFDHQVVITLARNAGIPVINGLTDLCHPCQALADYLTILESKGNLNRLKIAYVGDGNNVAHSLLQGAARLGAHLHVASPEGYEPLESVVRWSRDQTAETGCRIEVSREPREAVQDADVVYTDVWTSMGQEEESEQRRGVFQSYQINEALLSHAKPDAIFMHCLPAHRGEEVTASVLESSRSIVFQQAENRLHVQKAVMLKLMG